MLSNLVRILSLSPDRGGYQFESDRAQAAEAMNPAKRFYGRTAVFAAAFGLCIGAVGIVNLVTGFIGGTMVTVIAFVTWLSGRSLASSR